MTNHPTVAIFRIPPSEEGDKQFVQVELDMLGNIADEGKVFTVPEDSSYNELTFGNIVLAQATEIGSISLAQYTIFNEDNDGEAVVYEIVSDQLAAIIKHLVTEYTESTPAVLH